MNKCSKCRFLRQECQCKNVYELMEEAVAVIEKHYWDFVSRRGVEIPCHVCSGLGVRVYGSTAMWCGGIGGQVMTNGVCDHCWGSGDENKHWLNLRELKNK